MSFNRFSQNKEANEPISKFKLLSAYGGPGSIIHTSYGSIIVSCIEEWGFLNKVSGWIDEAENLDENVDEIIKLECKRNQLELSVDQRLLRSLQVRINITELKYLVLIPDIELNDFPNTIKDDRTELAINSSFMPKVFFDDNKNYKSYSAWYNLWKKNNANDKYCNKFFPPKHLYENDEKELIQDNVVLICKNGHISDFPWSRFLRYKSENHNLKNILDLLGSEQQECCNNPRIRITSSSQSTSGFDSKWIKCANCNKTASLSGLMNLKVRCQGHKPWKLILEMPNIIRVRRIVGIALHHAKIAILK